MASRFLRTRYAGTCAACSAPVPAGSRAWWDADSRALRCEACAASTAAPTPTAGPGDMGRAGRSAQREFERRRARGEDRTRSAHPRLGRLILALREEPQSTKAWAKGAEGERRVGQALDALVRDGCVVLHDRRIPGTHANIDHVVVAPSGVWVIDTKSYQGRIARRNVGRWLWRDERLYVGRRDCTKLVAGLWPQVAAVTAGLGVDAPAVEMRSVLCFVDAEWARFQTPFRSGDVVVAWPKATVKMIRRPGTLGSERIEAIGAHLAAALRPA